MLIQIFAAAGPSGDLVEPFDFCGRTIRTIGCFDVIIDGLDFNVWVVPDQFADELKEVNVKSHNVNLEQQLQESQRQLAELKVANDWLANEISDAKESAEHRQSCHRQQLIEVLAMTVKILQTV